MLKVTNELKTYDETSPLLHGSNNDIVFDRPEFKMDAVRRYKLHSFEEALRSRGLW